MPSLRRLCGLQVNTSLRNHVEMAGHHIRRLGNTCFLTLQMPQAEEQYFPAAPAPSLQESMENVPVVPLIAEKGRGSFQGIRLVQNLEKSPALRLLPTRPPAPHPGCLPGAAVLTEMRSLTLCIPLCPQSPRWCLPRSSQHAVKCRLWREPVPH